MNQNKHRIALGFTMLVLAFAIVSGSLVLLNRQLGDNFTSYVNKDEFAKLVKISAAGTFHPITQIPIVALKGDLAQDFITADPVISHEFYQDIVPTELFATAGLSADKKTLLISLYATGKTLASILASSDKSFSLVNIRKKNDSIVVYGSPPEGDAVRFGKLPISTAFLDYNKPISVQQNELTRLFVQVEKISLLWKAQSLEMPKKPMVVQVVEWLTQAELENKTRVMRFVKLDVAAMLTLLGVLLFCLVQMYGKEKTRFVQRLEELGLPAKDGPHFLAYCWTGNSARMFELEVLARIASFRIAKANSTRLFGAPKTKCWTSQDVGTTKTETRQERRDRKVERWLTILEMFYETTSPATAQFEIEVLRNKLRGCNLEQSKEFLKPLIDEAREAAKNATRNVAGAVPIRIV
jgi:hypothetical protein